MPNLPPHSTVLVAHAEPAMTEALTETLRKQGAVIFQSQDGVEAVRIALQEKPDLILLNVDLPRLSGYQCARVLKNEAGSQSSPLFFLGSANSPIERFWAAACGGDGYLPPPYNEAALEQLLQMHPPARSPQRKLLKGKALYKDLEETAILGYAAELTEQKLLSASILAEIHLIDILHLSTREVIAALLRLISSLYSFDIGAVLLIHDRYQELYFLPHALTNQQHLDKVKAMMFSHLRQREVALAQGQEVHQEILPSDQQGGTLVGDPEDLFIHDNPMGSSLRTVIAFENMGAERMRSEEKDYLHLALNLSHTLLERKILFHLCQELSVIDADTGGLSRPYLMHVLDREMAQVVRRKTELFLLELNFSGLLEAAAQKNLFRQQILRRVAGLVSAHARKSDIVARLHGVRYVFLFTNISEEKAEKAKNRLQKLFSQASKTTFPDLDCKIEISLHKYDPTQHADAQSLLTSMEQ